MGQQYVTIAEFEALAVTPAVFATLTTDEKNAHLQAASDIASGYLRTKSALPLTSWGSDLKVAVADIACWRVFSRRGYNPDSQSDRVIRQRYEDAVAWLGMVAEGDVSPDLIDINGVGTGTGSGVGGPDPGLDAQVVTSSQRGWSSRGRPRTGVIDDTDETAGGGFVGD